MGTKAVTATDGTNVTTTDDKPRAVWLGIRAGAVREVGRSARRHKVLSAIIALCAAGSLTAIGLIGANSGGAARPAVVAAPVVPACLPLGHSGPQVALSGYRGQPLIVNFFASWCEPCQKETPLLATFYRAEKGKIALVGLDENDVVSHAATMFTRAQGVSYPVGWDPAGTVATSYGVSALPQTFFLNARHQVVDRDLRRGDAPGLRRGIALATAKS